MRHLKTRPLDAARVAQAFPLIQAALPEVTLAAWRAFAAALMSSAPAPGDAPGNAPGGAPGGAPGDPRRDTPEGGILAVTDGRDYIAGLCSYRVVPDLVHGRLLDASHFLAFDLLDRRPVAEALAEGIEDLARRHGCGAVHTLLPHRAGTPDPSAEAGADNGLAELLAARGHRVENLGLCKRLAA